VLDDAAVEVAVLETARGGIIRGGLGYAEADVAVVTNVTADHLGDQGIDDLDELIDVKSLVAERVRAGGSVVLNADDQASAGLADRPAVRRNDPVIRMFSIAPGNPVLDRHKQAGGHCYEICDGQIVETAGGLQRVIMNLDELPGAFGGRARHVVANALAAVAASRATGVTIKDIREALGTFTPGAVNPGRGNVYAVAAGPAAAAAAAPVLVDYGHNAAALHATGQMIAAVWPSAAVAAITLPGDRRDDLVAASAQAIATYFGTVVVYEDEDLRGREPGEMRTLIMDAMRAIRPGVRVIAADGPHEALRTAIAESAGSPVLFLYEKLDPALAALDALGATPWPEEDLMGALDDGADLAAEPTADDLEPGMRPAAAADTPVTAGPAGERFVAGPTAGAELRAGPQTPEESA
jgi:cyanophycin synthetase